MGDLTRHDIAVSTKFITFAMYCLIYILQGGYERKGDNKALQ